MGLALFIVVSVEGSGFLKIARNTGIINILSMATLRNSTPCKPEKILTGFMRSIPRSDRNPADFTNLISTDVREKASVLDSLIPTIELLKAVGVVETFRTENPPSMSVRASSQTAYYFLRSLAEFIESDVSIVADWKRREISRDSPHPRPFDSGAQLLYLLEQRRLEEFPAPQPIRELHVSQAIVKARLRWSRQSVFLVQYDREAQQYQVIGGRMRSTDRDAIAVMRRELAEELPENLPVKERKFELKELAADLEHVGLSPTFGAYTKYMFTFFHVKFDAFELQLGENDRWVTIKEIKAGKTRDGKRIANEVAIKLDRELLHGLDGLGLSLERSQPFPLVRILRERSWEVTGILVSALGVLVAIIIFILQN